MSDRFSNPEGVREALMRAAQVLRPGYKSPEERARQALLEAAELTRQALPAPEGWRAERKILNLADRLFPVEEAK